MYRIELATLESAVNAQPPTVKVELSREVGETLRPMTEGEFLSSPLSSFYDLHWRTP
jgi:hypothetical protein